jgi:polysaccharide biosynthesis transport protein
MAGGWPNNMRDQHPSDPNSTPRNPDPGQRPAPGNGAASTAGRAPRGRPSSAAQFFARLSRYRSQLRRRWWLVLGLIVVALGAQFLMHRLADPLFESEGRMIVAIKLQIPDGSVYTEELSNFYGTQSALMQSEMVRVRALSRVAAEHPELPVCEVKLRVTVSPRTSIFNLQATGSEPEYTRRFIQAVMDEYIAYRREMRQQTSELTLAEIQEEVQRMEVALTDADDAVNHFRRENNVVFLEKESGNAAQRLGTLNNDLASFQSEYQLLQMLTVEQAQHRDGREPLVLPQPKTATVAPGGLSSGGAQAVLEPISPEYGKARQRLILLQAEHADLERFFRPAHPGVRRLQEEIERTERILAIYREQNIQQLEDRKDALVLRIRNMEKDVAAWQAKSIEIGRQMADYDRLQSARERVKLRYDSLLGMMQTISVNKNISQESVTVMEPASAPVPQQASLLRSLALAGLIGLGLSAGAIKLLDRLDDRMNSHTEVQQHFDEIILGQIPRVKATQRGRGGALLKPNDDRHPFVEAYRNLRSSLRFMSNGATMPRLVLITSSIPNDGKSVTALNLAITMAHAGTRVLLVDADLRRGSLHQHFAVPSQPGLFEVLAESLDWSGAIQSTPVENLSILPRGAATHGSSELFLQPRTPQVLKELATHFDCVLVDTPPVMAADDVTSLAPHTEGVLFVLRADHTSARVARAALDSLYHRNVQVLGVVFNAVRASIGENYYYYHYRDYYQSFPSR